MESLLTTILGSATSVFLNIVRYQRAKRLDQQAADQAREIEIERVVINQTLKEIKSASALSEIYGSARALTLIEAAMDRPFADNNTAYEEATAELSKKAKVATKAAFDQFVGAVTENWAIAAALIFVTLGVVGFLHSTVFYGLLGVTPTGYIESFQDFLQLAFSSGIAPIVFVFSFLGALSYITHRTVRIIVRSDASELAPEEILRAINTLRSRRIIVVVTFSIALFAVFLIADLMVLNKRSPPTTVITKSNGELCGRIAGSTSKHLFLLESSRKTGAVCSGLAGSSSVVPKSEILCVGSVCKKSKLSSNAGPRMTFESAHQLAQSFYEVGRDNLVSPEVDFRAFAKDFLRCNAVGDDFFESSQFTQGSPKQARATARQVMGPDFSLSQERKDVSDWIQTFKKDEIASFRLNVVGFASPEAAPSYNWDLSERRARWYLDYVLQEVNFFGATTDNTLTTGFGESVVLKRYGEAYAPESHRFVALIMCAPDTKA